MVLSGRADVILEHEDGEVQSLAIVDYKTAAGEEGHHDPQLQVYADAGRREGLTVRAVYVHDLGESERLPVDVSGTAISAAEQTVVLLSERMRARDFSPSPSPASCLRCDVRPMCRFAM